VRSFKAEFDRRDVAIIVISFAESAKLIRYQQYDNWPFVVLADPGRTAYRAFNLTRLSLFRVFSPSTLRLYFKLVREGARVRHYGKDDYYQAGGDFLLDRDGNVLFAHRSSEPSDRPAATRLLDAIDAVSDQRPLRTIS
jgi:peroxiredoxin